MGRYRKKNGRSWFGNALRNAGRFAKKTIGSKLGTTILGAAASVFGGPIAGIAVAKATSLLGKTKVGEMVAKVVTAGVVRPEKIVSTLRKFNIKPTQETINEVAEGLKAAASSISEKSIPIGRMSSETKAKLPDGSPFPKFGISIIGKVKAYVLTGIDWMKANRKKSIIYIGIPVLLIGSYVYFTKKKKGYRF